jgi:predicted transcriptional regulator
MLRLLRGLLAIPLNVLADEARVSARELHRIERGRVQPNPDTLKRIDDALTNLCRARIRLALSGGSR